jgi:hypothetical protein
VTAPQIDEVRRSPDGTTIAMKRGQWRYWRCAGGDSYDRSDDQVADWTPLVPAVSSPSGVPGDGDLRERLVDLIQSTKLCPGTDDGDMADTIMLHLVRPLLAERDADRADLRIRRNALARVLGEAATDEPRGGADFYRLVGQVEDLRAELADLRAGIENEASAHLMTRAERDALSLMLRRMAHERSEGRREYNSVARALRVKQEFQRGVSAVLADFGIATGGRLVPDTVDAIREALASRSTPPVPADTVVLPEDWESQIRRALAERAVDIQESGPVPGTSAYDRDGERVADDIAGDLVVLVHSWLSTPATDPDPLAVHDYCATLDYSTVHVPPGTTDPEDTDAEIEPGWWLVGHADGEVVVQVHLGDTLPATEPEPAAGRPGRPDEAVVDNAVAGALTDVYGFVPLDVRYDAARWARGIVERWLDKPGPVYDLLDDDANESMEEDPDASREEPEPVAPQAPAEPTGELEPAAGFGAWHRDYVTGPETAAWYEAEDARRNAAVSAVPEGPATPDDDGCNDDLNARFLKSTGEA